MDTQEVFSLASAARFGRTGRKFSTFLRRPSLAVLQKLSTKSDDDLQQHWHRKMSLPAVETTHEGIPYISAPVSLPPGPFDRHGPMAIPETVHMAEPIFPALHNAQTCSVPPVPWDSTGAQTVDAAIWNRVQPEAQQGIVAQSEIQQPQDATLEESPSLANQLLRKASSKISEALFAFDEVEAIYSSEDGAMEVDGLAKGPKSLAELQLLRSTLSTLQDAFHSGSFRLIAEAQKKSQENPRSILRKPASTAGNVNLKFPARDIENVESQWHEEDVDPAPSEATCTTETTETSITEPCSADESHHVHFQKNLPQKFIGRPSEPAIRMGWQQGWTLDSAASGTTQPPWTPLKPPAVVPGAFDDPHGFLRSVSDPSTCRGFTDSSLDQRIPSAHTEKSAPPPEASALKINSPADPAVSIQRKMSLSTTEKPPRPARDTLRRPSITPLQTGKSLPVVLCPRQRSQSFSQHSAGHRELYRPECDPLELPETPLRTPTTAELLVTPQAGQLNHAIASARMNIGQQSSLNVPFVLGPNKHQLPRQERTALQASAASEISPTKTCKQKRTQEEHLFRNYVDGTSLSYALAPQPSRSISDSESDEGSVPYGSAAAAMMRRPSGLSRRRPSTIVAGQVCDVHESSPVETLFSSGHDSYHPIWSVTANESSNSGDDARDTASSSQSIPSVAAKECHWEFRKISNANVATNEQQQQQQQQQKPMKLASTSQELWGARPELLIAPRASSSAVTVKTAAAAAAAATTLIRSSSTISGPSDKPATARSGLSSAQPVLQSFDSDGDCSQPFKGAEAIKMKPLKLRRQPSIDHAKSRMYRPRTSLIMEQDEGV